MTYHIRSFGDALPTGPAPTMSAIQAAINAIQAAVLTAGPATIDLAISRSAALPVACPAQQQAKDALIAALTNYKVNPTPAGMAGFGSLAETYVQACGLGGGGGGGGPSIPIEVKGGSIWPSVLIAGGLGLVAVALIFTAGKKRR